MSKKNLVQYFAIFLLILSVIILAPKTNWNDNGSVYGFISLISGALGSIVSIFIPSVYKYTFKESDWIPNNVDNDYFLSIKLKKHGIGNSPKAMVFKKNTNGYEEVVVFSEHDENGNILIRANFVFEGKVIIK